MIARIVKALDLRGTSNFEIHTDYHSWAMRERLIKANGQAGNQIIWTSPVPLIPPPAMADASFELLDRWLTAIEADKSSDPLEAKVARDKPPDAVDACFINDTMITDMQVCRAAFPFFASPRIVAGMPLTHDIARCQLKPLDRADYAGVIPPLTDEQWGRLQAVFPERVCDYGRPGFGQEASVPWMTFEDGPGGKPLGDPPVSVPLS